MATNDGRQNRSHTSNFHDNFFKKKPEDYPDIVEKAGLEPEYRDLLGTLNVD